MLLPMIQASQLVCGQDTLIAADAGYHSKENLQALAELNVEALIADNQMRQRDERLAGQAKHKAKGSPLRDKRRVGQAKRLGLYRPQELPATSAENGGAAGGNLQEVSGPPDRSDASHEAAHRQP